MILTFTLLRIIISKVNGKVNMICEKCNKNKELVEFWPDKRYRKAFRKTCFDCSWAERKDSGISLLTSKVPGKTIPQNMLEQAYHRALKGGLDFTITEKDIVIPEICPLLGIPLAPCRGKHGDGSPSLDRIDSDRGYTPDNVWVISHRANRIKYDATLEELTMLTQNLNRKVNG